MSFSLLRPVFSVALLVLVMSAGAPVLAVPKTGAGASWGASTPISGTLNPDPTRGSQLLDLATNAAGKTLAVWEQYSYNGNSSSSVGAAMQVVGRWSAPVTLSPSTCAFALYPRAAVGSDGTLAASWTCETAVINPPATATIQVVVRRPSATSWTSYSLETNSLTGGQIGSSPIAIDQSGNITVAWTSWNGTHSSVRAATLGPNSTNWAPVTVSANIDAYAPSLAANATGKAAVVYLGTTIASPFAVVFYSSRATPATPWSTPVTVSETIDWSIGYVQDPRVVLDSSGRSVVMFRAPAGLEVSRPNALGAWPAQGSVAIAATVPGASVLSPDIAVDDSGNAYVAVSMFDPTINVDRASVWVNRSDSNTWPTQVRLTDPTAPVDAYATQVAASTDGKLVIVGWIDHYHSLVQSSTWTGTNWAKAQTIGKGAAWASFQDILRLEAGSSTSARAAWKVSKLGLTVTAASFGN